MGRLKLNASGELCVITEAGATVNLEGLTSGGGAPDTVDYLTGTASGGLSNEIVVGTTPGGELGGTWGSPTVDNNHATGTHASFQAAAEATAATGVATHAGLADPHTGYRLESADHSHASTGLQGGTVAHSATTGQTATDHHAAPAAGPDADVTIDTAGAAGTASTFARSGHGHKVATSSAAAVAVGTAAAGTSGTAPSRGDHVHPTGAGTPSTQAMGDAAAVGTGPAAAMTDHKHAMPALGTTAAAVGTSSGGSASTPSKSDHVHAMPATADGQHTVAASVVAGVDASSSQKGHNTTGNATPSTQAFGDAAAAGSNATDAARSDHKHAMPAATVTRTLWIPGDVLASNLDSGTSSAIGTAPDIGKTVSLADAATQGFYFSVAVPNDWSTGAIQYTIYWSPGSTDASTHTVRWSTDAIKLVPGTTLVNAAGTTTAFTGTSAARTVNVLYTEPAQTLLTPTAVGDLIRANIRRLGADGADTYVGAVRVHGVLLTYTATR